MYEMQLNGETRDSPEDKMIEKRYQEALFKEEEARKKEKWRLKERTLTEFTRDVEKAERDKPKEPTDYKGLGFALKKAPKKKRGKKNTCLAGAADSL